MWRRQKHTPSFPVGETREGSTTCAGISTTTASTRPQWWTVGRMWNPLYVEWIERGTRALLFGARALTGVLSYDSNWALVRALNSGIRVLTSIGRALRLSHLPDNINEVWGLAQIDDKLRRLSIASNAVSLFGYPWEWMLLFVECYYLFQGAFTAEGPHWLGNVNVTSWIIWLILETIRSYRYYKVAFRKFKQSKHWRYRLWAKLSLVATFGYLMDLVIAIDWLPEGLLWANEIPAFPLGLLGVTSTLLYFYKLRLFNKVTAEDDGESDDESEDEETEDCQQSVY